MINIASINIFFAKIKKISKHKTSFNKTEILAHNKCSKGINFYYPED